MPQWISDVIAVWPWLGLNILIVVGIGVSWRFLKPPTKGLNHFLEDWNGETERPGVTGRPGVMVRFQKLEAWTAKYGPVIDKMEHELHPNSGTSLADAVNRTEKNLTEHIAACPPQQTTINVSSTGGQS